MCKKARGIVGIIRSYQLVPNKIYQLKLSLICPGTCSLDESMVDVYLLRSQLEK